MLSNGKLIICSIAFLSLAACSGSDSGGGKAAYSKDNAKLNEVAQNFNRIQRSASVSNQHSSGEISTSKPGGSVYEKSRRMEQEMSRCTVRMSQPGRPDRGEGNKFSFSMTIDGNCPISAKYSTSFAISDQGLNADYSVSMNINDATLAEMNDVYKASITGYIKGDQKGIAGVTKGTISSKQYGEVLVNGTLTGVQTGQHSGRLESRLGFTVQGELTEFVEIQDLQEGQQPKLTFQINGVTVTEQEYRAAFSKLGFLGQGTSMGDQTNVPPEDDGTTTQPPVKTEPGKPAPPPAPPTGPSDELYCRSQVASLKTYWTQTDVVLACRYADTNCVLNTIDKKPSWMAYDINQVCQFQVASCTNVLIPLKPYWPAGQIQTACKNNADSQCIAQMVNARPYASAEDLNLLCTR